jgi:hypothetical protein
MSFFRRCAAVLVASAAAFVAGRAEAAGSFAAPSAEAPESTGGFDVLRKPDIPMIFLAHNGAWIQFQYPPSARDRVAPLTTQADDLRAELAENLGQSPLDGVEVRIGRSLEEMSTLAPQGAPPPPQATSVSYPKLKLVVLSLAAAEASEAADLRQDFRRELARLALAEAVTPRSIPDWLGEGFVQYVARRGEWSREWVLYQASVRHGMHSVAELDGALGRGGVDASLASAEAADFVAFLLKPERRAEFAGTIERLRQGSDVEGAFASAYGAGLSTLERHWRTDRTRWSTLITVSLAIGVPALGFFVWSAVRSMRRRKMQNVGRVRAKKSAFRGPDAERGRVHIVLSRRDDRLEPPVISEAEVPRVEHEGEWHTLH